MPVWNFGCGMSNFNGAKLATVSHLPFHLSTLICIGVYDATTRARFHRYYDENYGNYGNYGPPPSMHPPSMHWTLALLLTGALFCFLGYLIAGIGLVTSIRKVLFGSLAIIGFGALLFVIGLCGNAVILMSYHAPYGIIFIPLIIYYLTLQVWSWCLIFGTALETMNSPTYPKDGPILLQ